MKVITQECFNDAVKENMEDLEMDIETALEETTTQFKLQGVDLTNIIKTVDAVQNCPVRESMDKIRKFLDTPTPELIPVLEQVRSLCNDDMAYKVAFGKAGLYNLLFEILLSPKLEEECAIVVFKSLIDLMNGFPDLLDDKGMCFILEQLDSHNKGLKTQLLLEWLNTCLIRHEGNRQKFHQKGVGNILKKYISNETDYNILRPACLVIKSMTLDDDIRFTVSSAHTHASALANQFLEPLSNQLQVIDNASDEKTLTTVISAINSLMVRNEYCEFFLKKGTVKVVVGMINKYDENEELVLSVLALLKSLAGNDDAKKEIITIGAHLHLVPFLRNRMGKKTYAGPTLLLISALCLRSEENGKAFIDIGCVDLIIQAIKIHKDSISVQQAGCWALRNMAAHNKDSKHVFVKAGVEDVMNNLLKEKKTLKEDINAVLVALELKADLTERWTGKHGEKVSN